MAEKLDVVVFGATGDTGVASCAHFYFQGKRLGISSWAPAARNVEKLRKEVLEPLLGSSPGDEGLAPAEPIQADSGDYDSLLRLCGRARCVLSCAGPFALYGEGLVRACAEAGTSYVDITGEAPWVESMKRKYGAAAEESGACIANCAGYDSVPPDLSAYLAAKCLEQEGERLGRFEVMVSGGGAGGLPTGTVKTMMNMVEASKRRALRAVTFGLLGKREPGRQPATDGAARSSVRYVPESEQANMRSNLLWTLCPGYSSLARKFCLPHFMAPVNVQAVHYTAAREGYAGLSYRERLGGVPSGPLALYGLLPALGLCALLPLAMLLLGLPYVTTLLKAQLEKLSAPGRQRVRAALLAGFQPSGRMNAKGFAVSKSGGAEARTSMRSSYDPGVGFTVLCANTVAAELAKRGAGGRERAEAGFHTAVVAVGGQHLAQALRHAGVEIKTEVVRTTP